MKIKKIFIYTGRLIITYINDEIKVFSETINLPYQYIYDEKIKIKNNKLVINDKIVYSLKYVYENSYPLFKDEYKIYKERNHKIWQAEITDDYLKLTFDDYSNALFYLKKFLDDNGITNIESFIINKDKIIINSAELTASLIYNNSYKWLNKKSNGFDVKICQQPYIKSFKWLSDDNNEMYIEFCNGKSGIYNFDNILYSERYIRYKGADILRNDIKYLHDNLYCDLSSFAIGDWYERDVIGYTSEEPIYFDTKLSS